MSILEIGKKLLGGFFPDAKNNIKNEETPTASIFDNSTKETLQISASFFDEEEIKKILEKAKNNQNLKTTENKKTDSVSSSWEKAKAEQGIVGKFWDGVKNFFGAQTGSKNIDKAVKALEAKGDNATQEEIDEVNKMIENFQSKQDNTVSTIGNTLATMSGAAAATAGASGGAAIGAAIGSIIPGLGTAIGAAVGGVIGGAVAGFGAGAGARVAVEQLDNITDDVVGNSFLNDEDLDEQILSGGAAGAIGAITGSITSKITSYVGKLAGLTDDGVILAKNGLASTSKTIAANAAANAAGNGVSSGLANEASYLVETALDDEKDFDLQEATNALLSGATTGALFGGIFGAIQGAGNASAYNSTHKAASTNTNNIKQQNKTNNSTNKTAKENTSPQNKADDAIANHNKNIETLKQKYKNGQLSKNEYTKLINEEYYNLRMAGIENYTMQNSINNPSQLQAQITKPTTGVRVYKYGRGWSARYAGKDLPAGITNRISLNVKGDANLLASLDDLMYKNRNFYYKTPTDISNWITRDDPITIYFSGKPSNQLIEAITKITKPYARGTIVGAENSSTPWLLQQLSPSKNDIANLIKEAAKYSKEFASAIQGQLSKGGMLSAGQYEAILKIMKELKNTLS